MTNIPSQRSPAPYGPNTGLIRQFLVRLAALGIDDRDTITARYNVVSEEPRWIQVERRLAALVERSGRQSEQEAIAGPMLQLVRRLEVTPDVPSDQDSQGSQDSPNSQDPLQDLDPVAEPILAALLALLVHDIMQKADFNTLYSPVEQVIPFNELSREATW